MKCAVPENVETSIEHGRWATSPTVSSALSKAFAACDRVVLLFSNNTSNGFQGYATMQSDIGAPSKLWNTATSLAGDFRVRWHAAGHLDFNALSAVLANWDVLRHVRRSANGDELSSEIGHLICKHLDATALKQGLYVMSESGRLERRPGAPSKSVDTRSRTYIDSRAYHGESTILTHLLICQHSNARSKTAW